MMFTYLLPTLLATLAAASPTRVLDKRETTWCSSYGSVETGGYTFYHNNWGAAQATSGSQCTTVDGVTDGSAVWSTSWTWAGGSSSVKSYSNVALTNVGTQLSAISSIPSKWTWSYTGSDIVADVAYDLWLAPTASGDNQYEIMIWLGAYGGAGPISSTGSPVATPTLAGSSWKLYSGANGDTTVFSFVATSNVTSFDGDLNEFFTYLTSNQGVSTSMYATSLQAGTEPFTGTNAVFKTSAYTISVEKSGSSNSSESSSSGSSETPVASVSSTVAAVSTPYATPVTFATPVTLVTSVITPSSAVSVPVVPSETPAIASAPASSATPTTSRKKCHV